jgi:hypothetical protein
VLHGTSYPCRRHTDRDARYPICSHYYMIGRCQLIMESACKLDARLLPIVNISELVSVYDAVKVL